MSPWPALTLIAAAAGTVMTRVGARPLDCRHMDRDGRAFAGNGRAKLLRLAVGIRIGVGVNLFVFRDMDSSVVAGAIDRHIAARILHVNRTARSGRRDRASWSLSCLSPKSSSKDSGQRRQPGKTLLWPVGMPWSLLSMSLRSPRINSKRRPRSRRVRLYGSLGVAQMNWSNTHSASRTTPATTSSTGHQWPYQLPERFTGPSRPVSISRNRTPMAISRMGPSAEPRRRPRIRKRIWSR